MEALTEILGKKVSDIISNCINNPEYKALILVRNSRQRSAFTSAVIGEMQHSTPDDAFSSQVESVILGRVNFKNGSILRVDTYKSVRNGTRINYVLDISDRPLDLELERELNIMLTPYEAIRFDDDEEQNSVLDDFLKEFTIIPNKERERYAEKVL